MRSTENHSREILFNPIERKVH